MKHWMAIAVAGVLATGLSVADGMHHVNLVRTPGLPVGWSLDGFAAGRDEVAVDRPADGGPPELVVRRGASGDARPLAVYQTIDATPWRGRTLQFSSYTWTGMDPDTMRRTRGAKATELHIECDGGARGTVVSLDATWQTRAWIEHNIPIDVPADATRCRFGMAATVPAELRMRRVHLKDYDAERAAFIAKRWPDWRPKRGEESLFAAPAAAASAQPNLEFKQ
jgi:hypothetical protein